MAVSPTIIQDLLDAKASGLYNYDTVTAPGGPYAFAPQNKVPDGITLRAGEDEMLRVEKNGFYIRGVKVAQDDKEAEAVYNAFKQWLTWATLHDSK